MLPPAFSSWKTNSREINFGIKKRVCANVHTRAGVVGCIDEVPVVIQDENSPVWVDVVNEALMYASSHGHQVPVMMTALDIANCSCDGPGRGRMPYDVELIEDCGGVSCLCLNNFAFDLDNVSWTGDGGDGNGG